MCDYIRCQNNGTCERSTSEECYKCNCAPGFSGKICLDIIPEDKRK